MTAFRAFHAAFDPFRDLTVTLHADDLPGLYREERMDGSGS